MSSEEHSLRIISREEHNSMGINKDDTIFNNMATAEIEIECSQPSCLESVVKLAEDNTDESYHLNTSNFGESCVCVCV